MRRKLAALTVIAALALAAPAGAHHNAGLIFDLTQEVTVEGVVTRFNPGNPHTRIYFTRSDGVGEPGQEWMAEGGSRTVLLRRDWTNDLLKEGDVVTITGQPARGDAPVMHMEWVTLPDGRMLWAEDSPPPEAIGAMIARSAGAPRAADEAPSADEQQE